MNKYEDLFSKVKTRKFADKNYHAIWHNLKTVRLGYGVVKELEPEYSEFFDVGINTKCNAECSFCYVSANKDGVDYTNICETWKKWMNTFPEDEIIEGTNIIKTKKAFQIAIGSTGEPTIHPQFCKFLQTVYETGVVPNYTSNGIILSYYDKPDSKYFELANKILYYTKLYVGGVAISFGNKSLRKYAENAVTGLIEKGDCKINLHHIISDKESVDEFIEIQERYGNDIYYHVLLPLMPSGRSNEGLQDGVWEYLEDKLSNNKLRNVSFGAHFIDKLKNSKKINTWLYPAESLSKNIMLKENKVVITPSSFNLTPIKTIDL